MATFTTDPRKEIAAWFDAAQGNQKFKMFELTKGKRYRFDTLDGHTVGMLEKHFVREGEFEWNLAVYKYEVNKTKLAADRVANEWSFYDHAGFIPEEIQVETVDGACWKMQEMAEFIRNCEAARRAAEAAFNAVLEQLEK